MKLAIDHQSPIPLYVQVENLLRKLIREKKYQEGNTALPKEEFLSKTLGISRNTVRQAIAKLVHEDLIVRKRRKGSFVKQQALETDLANFKSFTQEMNKSGAHFEALETKALMCPADAQVAGALEIDPDREVLQLNRLKGIKGEPMVYFVSYIHPRVGLSLDDDFARPLYDIIEKDHGVSPALSREKVNAMAADKTLASLLDIKVGEPILFRRRIVLDPGGKPIEYNLCYYHQDHFTFTIDIKSKN